ncbi:NYN domain-containing protein [Aeromonas media]|uniref:NYN domain-containing protein n=1 Tax=Aeromonas media TaxID=651 RepID=UPI00143DAA54|nr:NYN domain-containing protein [Aeromonas media]MBS4699369.1 hypothetical protein [Aeromonas media]QIY85862.1 NYN domain-containing protein [Aeromonas hydrophila]
MAKLNIFIDGSWLFKACAPERALSSKLEFPERRFKIDFKKLINAMLEHADENTKGGCKEFGGLYFATSIFELPEDLDEWPDEHENISTGNIEHVKNTTRMREMFTNTAIEAGFLSDAIFRPRLKGWMIENLKNNKFQEKQVDAIVVALLVKHAITQPEDVHAIITGDTDILPAIKVAYPQYSNNVFVATTHPDQLKSESRQTSYALTDFNYSISPFFLERKADKILEGENVYTCSHCNKIFSRAVPIPAKGQPCCKPCHQKRT